jgi:integrase/recombinase XerD
MPKELVTLKVRIRLSDGSRPYVQPARYKNRKLKFGYVLIDGVERKHEGGVYTLCFRRDGLPAYETIANPADAEVELAKKKLALEGAAQGMVMVPQGQPLPYPVTGALPQPQPVPVGTTSRRSLKGSIASYLKEKREHKAQKTYAKYRSNLEYFGEFWQWNHVEKAKEELAVRAWGQQSDAKPWETVKEPERAAFRQKVWSTISRQEKAAMKRAAATAYDQAVIEDIGRQDLLDYALYGRMHIGDAPITTRERVTNIQGFLHHFNIASFLTKKKGDLPKFTKKTVRKYNKVMLQAMFDVATQDEYELLHFFLGIGARAAEGAYATYPDIDYVANKYTVTEHLDLGFTPKDGEEGTFPIAPFLTEMLATRRVRCGHNRLIFPGKKGGPDKHLLRRIKRIGLRAKVNCGYCTTVLKGKTVSCATHPVCELIILHTMRKTYASMLHKSGCPARTIMRYLRHSDIQTTLSYLADDEDDDDTLVMMDSTFSPFARSAAPAPPA